MRETITLTEGSPLYAEMLKKSELALAPENLRIVAKGEKNKKAALPGIEKNGITFYVAGEIREEGDQIATVFKGNPTSRELAIAKENTVADARIGGIFDAMFGTLLPIDDWEPTGQPMYVLTNKAKYQGAGVILCDKALKQIYKKLGKFYILPSSIHEVIICPVSVGINGKDLVKMVQTVNAAEVSEEEQLSDEAFLYNGKTWRKAN